MILCKPNKSSIVQKFIPYKEIPEMCAGNYTHQDFNRQSDVKIISIGCSYVFGNGLDSKDLFHNTIKEKTKKIINKKVVNYNLASSGMSNDYISRILSLAIPVIKPNIVLINFTHLSRREYFCLDEKKHHCTFIPNFSHHHEKEYNEIMLEITNQSDDKINFFKNYKTIEMLCDINNIDFLYSHIQENKISSFENLKFYAGHLQRLDQAFDNIHPGKLSHKILADNYWDKLMENKYLEKYK